jgi:hypothetical protein
MSLAFSRRRKHRGGGVQVGVNTMTGQLYPGQESSLSGILPTTTWGSWGNYPGSLAWSASAQAPPPLANGGLYTGPQSTGDWASSPFPATQYGEMVEAVKTSGLPDVFYHQRPNDNTGASFSPYVSVPLSPLHYSAQQPASGAQAGGSRRNRKYRQRHKQRKAKKTRRHK